MKTNSTNINRIIIGICIILCLAGRSYSQVSFMQHTITTNYTLPTDIFVKDINQDGYMDFVTTANTNGGQVAWWENNGQSDFTIHIVKNNFPGARSARAEDLDGDGDIDIIAAAWQDNDILWWENDGDENFTSSAIDLNYIGAHTVEIRDLDADGDLDVLCSGFDLNNHNGEAAWWENDGDENFTKHLLSDRYQQSPFIYAEDMDADGDMDVIACGELNNEICWYENDGNENFTEYIIDGNIGGIHTIIARDVNKDGYMDILASACIGSRFAWYENDGNKNFTRIEIENANGAIWLDAFDIDEDGDNDLIGTGMGLASLVWYENDGYSNLSRHEVEGALGSGFALVVVDMDGDFDKDIVAIGNQTNSIAWFENLLPNQSFLSNPESIVWDVINHRYLVSNKENGLIVDINSSAYQTCFKTGLNFTTGMTISGGLLYVGNGGQVLGLDLDIGHMEQNFRLDGAQEIEDLCSDNLGFIYASDYLAEKIYRLDPADQSSEILAESGISSPHGVLFEESSNSIIFISGENNAEIRSLSLENYSITTLAVTGFSVIDDIISDGQGNYIVSAPSDNSIYIFVGGFDNSPVLLSSELDKPTGLYYKKTDNKVIVLNSGSNSISEIPVIISDINNIIDKELFKLSVFPNPVFKKAIIEFWNEKYQTIDISVLDSNGSLLKNLQTGKIERGKYSILWNGTEKNGTSLPGGIYFIQLNAGGKYDLKKVVLVN